MKEKKGILIAGAAAVVIAVILLVAASALRPQTEEGLKSITVEVIHQDGSQKTFSIETRQTFLEKALVEERLIEGENGEFGLFVTSVDGETSDFSKDGSWWELSVDGKKAESGAGQIVLEDGHVYTWKYIR